MINVYLVIGDGRRGQYCQQPHDSYGHVHGSSFVLRRPADDYPVPVDGYYRDSAHGHHDVGALKQGNKFAEHGAHVPLVSQQRSQRERHAHQAQCHVRNGQIHYV